MKLGAPKGHTKVIWTDNEWQAVALALLKTQPDYIDHPHPVIAPNELRDAMLRALPPDRHRPVPAEGGAGCSHFRPGLLKAYKVIRDTLNANGRASDPELAALSDLTLPQAHRSKKRIKWNNAEFILLARYLRERYPGASYLESSTCAGLQLADIREAMLATLPTERHRPLFTITPLRPFFVGAFKAAKAEQYREHERLAREQAAQERAAQEAMAAAQVPAIAPPPAVAANPYEAAFAPLLKPIIGLLAQELLAQLGPQIAQIVESAIGANRAPAAPVQIDDDDSAPDAAPDTSAMAQPANVTQLRDHPSATSAPKKVMVGVVGPLPIQRNELQRAFPELHIVTLDGTNTNEAVARLRNARRVIGMTSFMNHSMDGTLARQFADRYMRVHGGVSSIKRQIKVWAASGVLAA